MNKLKKALLGIVSALTIGLFAVAGTKVKAASLENGTVLVSTTVYAGDTKTWGFTTNLPSSNTNIAVGSDINGIVSAKDGTNKSNAAPIQIKNSASNGYDAYPGAEFLVPVPSADSTGTVTRTGNANNSRYLALGSNAAVALASPMTFDFDTDDIETNPTLSNNSTVTGYYLRFVVSGGEAKTYSISVQLKDGTTTYGEVATLHTVTYMDGTTTLKTDAEAVDGSNVSYKPKKYGYDFEGWYTESTLDNKISNAYTVTDDVTLYANWTSWTTTGIEEYTLSNAAIEKIATGIDGNLSADLALTPSIYTAMSGVGMTTTNVTLPGESSDTQAPCFNTNGAVKTNGNGLKFIAPANGTLTAYVGAGGGSERNIKLTDGTNVLEPTAGSTVVGNIESARYTPVEIVYTLEEGTTYYFGGDNGVRIYYLSFEEQQQLPTATFGTAVGTDNDNNTAIAFIVKLENVEDVTLLDAMAFTVNATFNQKVGNAKNYAVSTCYEELTAFGDANTNAAVEGTYYVYFTVYGITPNYSGMELDVTFNATYDGSAITANKTYTYTA